MNSPHVTPDAPCCGSQAQIDHQHGTPLLAPDDARPAGPGHAPGSAAYYGSAGGTAPVQPDPARLLHSPVGEPPGSAAYHGAAAAPTMAKASALATAPASPVGLPPGCAAYYGNGSNGNGDTQRALEPRQRRNSPPSSGKPQH